MKYLFYSVALYVASLGFVSAAAVYNSDDAPETLSYRTLNNVVPLLNDGMFVFDDNLDLELDLGKKGKNHVRLHKRSVDGLEDVVEQKTAIYSHDDIVLQKDCSEGTCKQYALINSGKTSTYINGDGKALVLPEPFGEHGFADSDTASLEIEDSDLENVVVDETDESVDIIGDTLEANELSVETLGDIDNDVVQQFEESTESDSMQQFEETLAMNAAFDDSFEIPIESFVEPELNLEAGEIQRFLDSGGLKIDGGRSHRQKRGVVSPRVIKLLWFADKAVVDRFLPMNGNDLKKTHGDIKHFLTLVCNSMTMHYQTLKEYGKPMMVKGKPEPMNIAIKFVDVIFPSETDVEEDFPWIKKNVVGDALLNNVTILTNPDNKTTTTKFSGALAQFSIYMRGKRAREASVHNFSSDQYDHAMTLTGQDMKAFDFAKDDPNPTERNLLGFAWTKSMCRKSYRAVAFDTSMVEFSSWVARTAAHEMGHALGAQHDAGKCPSSKHMMSADTFHPNANSSDTYYKFSECSADDISNFTSNIKPYDFLTTCLEPADTQANHRLCQGLHGAKTSLHEQCAMHYGLGSKRARYSNLIAESRLNHNFVETCLMESKKKFPFACTKPGVTDKFFIIPGAAPGTNCVLNGKLHRRNVCYHGRCVARPRLC